ncbi:hypothetical protein [Mesorhizobium sp. ANAO-SY3R2]|uniref:hypothetical protein n=1 Tax=Mesorhizobium sp. ANAO-SY3R2 TaxID=3166644 RepID=UPI00366D8A93
MSEGVPQSKWGGPLRGFLNGTGRKPSIAVIQSPWLSASMTSGRRLTEEEFQDCFAHPMIDITEHAEAVVDIWPYVDALDLHELGIPYVNDVHYVYRDAHDRFDQILLGTGRFNALLVIVVELGASAVFGHFLLDLNEEHGASGGLLRSVC